MLKVLRTNLRSLSWVLWVVIAAFVGIVFLEVGIGTPGGPAGPGDAAAWAGDAVVTYQDYKRGYQNLESYYRQMMPAGMDENLTRQVRLQAIDQALNRELMLLEARDLGLRVSDEELRDQLRDVTWLWDDNGLYIGDERYQQVVRYSLGYTSTEEFEDDVRGDILVGKLNNILESSVNVTEGEVEQAYRNRVERATLRYFTLPQSQVAGEIEISDDEVAAYYEAHQGNYSLPAQRIINYLLLDVNRLRAQVEVPEDEIQARYAAAPEEYSQEEQVRARLILIGTDERSQDEAVAEAERIKARIEGGADFGEMARQFSEDAVTRNRGGEKGYFPRGRNAQAFDEAAFNAQVGDLVGPVSTGVGAYLIEVQDRREGGLQPFEQVAPRIRIGIATERAKTQAEEEIGTLLARINEDAAGSPLAERMRALAEEKDYVTFNTTQPFGRNDVVAGIGVAEEFRSAAFGLEQGAVSEPVNVGRGWTILALEEAREPRQQELSEVQSQVRSAALQEKQQQAATQRLAQAREEIISGKDFEAAAQELGLAVQESAELSAGSSLPAFGGAAVSAVSDALESQESDLLGPYQAAQGAVLAQVVERKVFDPQELEEQAEELERTLENQKYQQLVSSLIAQRRAETNPQYAKDVAADFTDPALGEI